MSNFDRAIGRAPVNDFPPRRPMLGHPLMFAAIVIVVVTLVIFIGNKALGQAAYDAANHQVERY